MHYTAHCRPSLVSWSLGGFWVLVLVLVGVVNLENGLGTMVGSSMSGLRWAAACRGLGGQQHVGVKVGSSMFIGVKVGSSMLGLRWAAACGGLGAFKAGSP